MYSNSLTSMAPPEFVSILWLFVNVWLLAGFLVSETTHSQMLDFVFHAVSHAICLIGTNLQI